MIIGKPYRFMVPVLLAAGSFVLLSACQVRIWINAFVSFIFYCVCAQLISSFDLWLRKKTKDQLWLWSYEGKEWLETEEGKSWKADGGEPG